jgi:murein DD-endopeptidase MepM/ murein hydrolase activator NlpD
VARHGQVAARLAIFATFATLAPSLACRPAKGPMHPETPAGTWYVVEKGETLDAIAKRAGVPAEDILEINGLTRPEDVRPGKLLFVLAAPGAVAEGASAATDGARVPSRPVLLGVGARFSWPLANVAHTVGSPFGSRGGRAHEGIDLPAPMGTPVLAAGDGEVVYAGDGIRGYGNLVVLQHPGDLLTVYAHNAQVFVAPGQAVRGGERIAAVGQTGRASGPHLHFEVREGQIPRDPMPFLSATATAGNP